MVFQYNFPLADFNLSKFSFLRVKSVLTESKYKQQRNKVNNFKKQAKKKFYANVNENLDKLKSANGKLYWKTMNMLIKNENSSNASFIKIIKSNGPKTDP
jgi:hypothetical protein